VEQLPKGMVLECPPNIGVIQRGARLAQHNYIAEISQALANLPHFQVEIVGTNVQEAPEGTVVQLTLTVDERR
jgi:hypothetical protein